MTPKCPDCKRDQDDCICASPASATEVREQVEKLRVERDEYGRRNGRLRSELAELDTKLAALAEQNVNMRKVLLRLACLGNGDQYGNSIGNCIAQEALSLPDLATPVLNRIRAEGMRMAAEICETTFAHGILQLGHRAAIAKAIRAKADELENSDG